MQPSGHGRFVRHHYPAFSKVKPMLFYRISPVEDKLRSYPKTMLKQYFTTVKLAATMRPLAGVFRAFPAHIPSRRHLS
ncbi:hypothetical protein [Agrobacterium sp. Azo12]|uniref:hypothetical protein n=1 Tax=Agrobacterium sp. Azo12 TaxID=3031129 RepID=UPI0023D8C249|nr:hypothetical protein [Agrobacterium sp. Azo12]MDO5895662.1 hypothetical protein [Agrobacterium sp. Azo12]